MSSNEKKISEDLLSRIARLGPTMHPAERRIADLVLTDMDFTIHARTTEIATRAGVSTASITRFCRTVGCAGLRELKLDLAKLLAIGDRYLHPRTVPLGASEAMTEIVSLIHGSLDSLVTQIADETMKRAAKSIARAKARHDLRRRRRFVDGQPWKRKTACSGSDCMPPRAMTRNSS